MWEFRIKRIYETLQVEEDGLRVLVDRLWPRGIRKTDAHVDLWLKELAPSTVLRRHFHANPDLWEAFEAAYRAELQTPEAQEAGQGLLRQLNKGPVTLLYAARDVHRNHAIALKDWLQSL